MRESFLQVPTGQTRLGWLGLALGCCLFALTCGECGSASVAGGAGGPGVPVSRVGVIVTRAASASSASSPSGQADHRLTISASCGPGEQMVAGGYGAGDVFESGYTLRSTYPSALDTWTVSVTSISSYGLTTYVYCVASSPSLGIAIHQAAACPTGTVPVSAGFRGTYAATGNTATPYVLCASRGVTLTSQGFRVGSTQLDCAHQATGNSQSESRSFSYMCTAHVLLPG